MYPSSLIILLNVVNISSLGPSRPATCILDFTVIYGYVMLVASNLPNAPIQNASLGVTRLFFSSICFNCSNTVYCNIGLMTKTKAGMTPANRRAGPSSRTKAKSVLSVEGAFWAGVGAPGSVSSDFRVVMRVFMTQMGFVISTVALPARAPASMLSTVVSLEEARPALSAAFSKKERVHSYPGIRQYIRRDVRGKRVWGGRGTVVVYKVRNADAEKRRVKAGVESRDTFALYDASRGIERRGLGALGFDLGACGEGDERVAASC
jgi:hypothetical protein